MKWGISKLKIIHWHFENGFILPDQLYKPEMNVKSNLHDIIGSTTDWNWWFTWRFRIYDESKGKAYLSCIGENFAQISYTEESENDEKDLYRAYGSCKINFELRLVELVKENNLPSEIRYPYVFELRKDQIQEVLAVLRRKPQKKE